MIRESYEELKLYVASKTGKSYNMTQNILKEYSTVVKDAIKEGYTVNVEGLVTIYYTTKEGTIYRNREYNLEEQIEDVTARLNIDRLDIRTVLVTYLTRMQDCVLDGYQVNLKGVCYLIPTEDEQGVLCVPRVSPVLEKPEGTDFVITTENGLELVKLGENDLRFKIEVEEGIEILDSVATEEQETVLQLKKVNV